MNSFVIILKNDYIKIILSVISYILIRVEKRLKYKDKIDVRKEFIIVLFIVYLQLLFNVVTYPMNEYGINNYSLFNEFKRYKIGSYLFIKNIIGNIILFIPFGMFYKSYFNIRLISLIMITILYSFIIEISQLLIGRVFDVDDILLNLIGSIIGYYFSKNACIFKNHMIL